MKDKQIIKRKELLLDQVDKLRKIKLPPEWEVAKLDVEFKRKGFLGDFAVVTYDSMNNCFYTKTNKAIVYKDDEKALLEGLKIMKQANSILIKELKNEK